MKGHRWFAAVYDAISRDDERRELGRLRRWVVGEAIEAAGFGVERLERTQLLPGVPLLAGIARRP
jgi:hypothetical protein